MGPPRVKRMSSVVLLHVWRFVHIEEFREPIKLVSQRQLKYEQSWYFTGRKQPHEGRFVKAYKRSPVKSFVSKYV